MIYYTRCKCRIKTDGWSASGTYLDRRETRAHSNGEGPAPSVEHSGRRLASDMRRRLNMSRAGCRRRASPLARAMTPGDDAKGVGVDGGATTKKPRCCSFLVRPGYRPKRSLEHWRPVHCRVALGTYRVRRPTPTECTPNPSCSHRVVGRLVWRVWSAGRWRYERPSRADKRPTKAAPGCPHRRVYTHSQLCRQRACAITTDRARAQVLHRHQQCSCSIYRSEPALLEPCGGE